MKKILFIIILSLTSICYATNNNDNWYQVNIVIFEHITAQNLNSEQWPQVTPPNVGTAIIPDLLPTSKSQLKSAVRRLNRRKDYQVLVNMAWQQQLPDNKTQYIRIAGGQNYNGINQLDGVMTINKRRYFDISTNLILTEATSYLEQIGPANYADSSATYLRMFQMRQGLRMRSNEIGYIDHPLFGVLVKIVPLKTPPDQSQPVS